MALRAMHSLGGGAGWGDVAVLVGIVALVGAFLAWGWWQRRKRRA